MFAFGAIWDSVGSRGLIARTSDGGQTWEDTAISRVNNVLCMTDPNRDTIIAAGESGNRILISTDRGITWANDSSIVVRGSADLQVSYGLAMTPGNHIVAAFLNFPTLGDGYLLRGSFSGSAVDDLGHLNMEAEIYPNPTSEYLNISVPGKTGMIYLYDMLGRKVECGTLNANGLAELNLSSLPVGVYEVIFESEREVRSIGSIIYNARFIH